MKSYMSFFLKVRIQEQDNAFLFTQNICRTAQLHTYFEELKIHTSSLNKTNVKILCRFVENIHE